MQRHGGSRLGIRHTNTCANYHIQGVERVVAGSGRLERLGGSYATTWWRMLEPHRVQLRGDGNCQTNPQSLAQDMTDDELAAIASMGAHSSP